MAVNPTRPILATKLPTQFVRGLDNRLADLQSNLIFCCYPQSGIVFDIAKGRNADSLSAVASLVESYDAEGHPGINASTIAGLWSSAITTDVGMPASGVGVSGNYSFWMWCYVRAVSSGTTDTTDVLTRANYVSEASNQGWKFQKHPAAFGADGTPRMGFFFYNNDGFVQYAMTDSSLTLAAGQVNNYVALIQFDPAGFGGNKQLYRAGTQQVSAVGFGYTPTSGVALGIGGKSGTNDIIVLGFAVWSKTLTDIEIGLLNDYPECLMAPIQRPMLWTPSAPPATSGGLNYYLMAGQGNV